MEKTVHLEVKYEAGHSYAEGWNFEDGLFCPHCGQQRVWWQVVRLRVFHRWHPRLTGGDTPESVELDLAIAENLGDGDIDELLQKGYDGYVTNRADIESVIKAIEEATAILY